MKKTTDLSTIRAQPNLYTWGQIIRIHDLGKYAFVQHYWNYVDNKDSKESSFSIYIDEKDIGRSCSSLESAMITAVSFSKLKEPNTAGWMASAAMKLFEPEKV